VEADMPIASPAAQAAPSRRYRPLDYGRVSAGPESPGDQADDQLAQIKRRNALTRNSEQMFAVVKRFKDLCQAGVIVSKTTQAECDRIIAAVEGGAS
jgi:hypothetical protein